ncbi:hypothetical protein ACLOJK_029482 [Asimina triloba]
MEVEVYPKTEEEVIKEQVYAKGKLAASCKQPLKGSVEGDPTTKKGWCLIKGVTQALEESRKCTSRRTSLAQALEESTKTFQEEEEMRKMEELSTRAVVAMS